MNFRNIRVLLGPTIEYYVLVWGSGPEVSSGLLSILFMKNKELFFLKDRHARLVMI